MAETVEPELVETMDQLREKQSKKESDSIPIVLFVSVGENASTLPDISPSSIDDSVLSAKTYAKLLRGLMSPAEVARLWA